MRDLAARWARSRRAAAARVVGHVRDEAEERDLLDCAAEVDERELHRALFENGVRLGDGYRRFHRHTVALEELPVVLSSLGVKCLEGDWEQAPPAHQAVRLVRPPCDQACTARQCDAWREAIDGLVVGLTGEVRHTRVASRGHGQAECIDVLTTNAESPLRWGDLPDELKPALSLVERFVERFKGAQVRFLGLSEGVLLYRLDTSECGELRDNARQLVEGLLAQKLPTVPLRELSPRPVIETP